MLWNGVTRSQVDSLTYSSSNPASIAFPHLLSLPRGVFSTNALSLEKDQIPSLSLHRDMDQFVCEGNQSPPIEYCAIFD